MDFYDVIRKRRSYRFYTDQIPEKEKIERILEAARLSPTWANMQGVKYVIVQEKAKVKDIWQAIGQKKKFQDAPIFVVGLISEKDSGKNMNGEKYYPVDFGICFEHLILAAAAEGLGTCWIGWFNEQKVKQILNIPKKYRVLGLTPMGYPQKEKSEVSDRKEVETMVFYDEFA
ncbi:MAG: nitroreductase [Candidatus Lokiarchaeota archaeon]|nr:nitroreductase [Candidatus Lokiarchaeota archaeon]MBD3199900.1 nitroreductase [Candidatus Lokiarchaeota archaeon]